MQNIKILSIHLHHISII